MYIYEVINSILILCNDYESCTLILSIYIRSTYNMSYVLLKKKG